MDLLVTQTLGDDGWKIATAYHCRSELPNYSIPNGTLQ